MKTAASKITRSVRSKSKPNKRVRLSGWQYEKLRREKREAEARLNAQASAERLIKRRIVKLRSIGDCLDEFERTYQELLDGTEHEEKIARRVHVLDKTSAALEKQAIELLRMQLEKMPNVMNRLNDYAAITQNAEP